MGESLGEISVIPKRVREQMQLKPGMELLVFVQDGMIRLSPLRSIKDLRGMAKGMKWKDVIVTAPTVFESVVVHSSGRLG